MNDKNLWKVFSLFIRLKHSDENGTCTCYTCGRMDHYTKMDCGHGIPRQHKATKFDEKNNRPQCKKCNGFEGGKREKFKEAMDKEHGLGTWDLMELKSRQLSKAGQFEWDVLQKYYAQEVRRLMSEKGLK